MCKKIILVTLGGYSLGHVYEDLESSQHMLEIVRTYVAAVNKEPEDIGKKLNANTPWIS